MSDAAANQVKKWQDAPAHIREQLVELLKGGHSQEAVKLLREHRSIDVRDAHIAIRRLYDAMSFAPCPKCGEQLRTPSAQQCFKCGANWHQTGISGDPGSG
jgi:hypothetical protein